MEHHIPYILILSKAFQLSGALILIIHFWNGTKKTLELSIFTFTSPNRNKEDKVVVPKKILQQRAFPIYLNRFAFIYIAIGFILSIFSHPISINKVYTLILILFVSVALCIIGYCFIKIFIRCKYRTDWIYEDKYIEQNYSGVPLTAKQSEIDELIKIISE